MCVHLIDFSMTYSCRPCEPKKNLKPNQLSHILSFQNQSQIVKLDINLSKMQDLSSLYYLCHVLNIIIAESFVLSHYTQAIGAHTHLIMHMLGRRTTVPALHKIHEASKHFTFRWTRDSTSLSNDIQFLVLGICSHFNSVAKQMVTVAMNSISMDVVLSYECNISTLGKTLVSSARLLPR